MDQIQALRPHKQQEASHLARYGWVIALWCFALCLVACTSVAILQPTSPDEGISRVGPVDILKRGASVITQEEWCFVEIVITEFWF